jgi:hypothetical protein
MQDMVAVNATQRKFYIAVFGETAATFRLLAYTSDANNRELVFDCTESGYVAAGDIVNYQLFIYGLKSTNVTLSLTTITGDTNLFVKRCSSGNNSTFSQCVVTPEDLKNQASLKEPDFYTPHNSGGRSNVVKFFYNASECNLDTDSATACAYAAAVVGGSAISSGEESHYKLTARHPLSHIHLKENEQFRSQLELGDEDNYKFTVHDASGVAKVDFQVIAISGEIDVYVNRTDRFPTLATSERAGFLGMDSLVYTNKSDGDLTGNYYIRVVAFSAANYYI